MVDGTTYAFAHTHSPKIVGFWCSLNGGSTYQVINGGYTFNLDNRVDIVLIWTGIVPKDKFGYNEAIPWIQEQVNADN